jgi:hypothetical protein
MEKMAEVYAPYAVQWIYRLMVKFTGVSDGRVKIVFLRRNGSIVISQRSKTSI